MITIESMFIKPIPEILEIRTVFKIGTFVALVEEDREAGNA